MPSVKVRDNESFDIAMRTAPGLPEVNFLERVSLWINDLDTHLKFAHAQCVWWLLSQASLVIRSCE